MNSIKVVLQKELARVFHDKKLVFSLFIMPALLLIIIYSIIGNMMNRMVDDIQEHIPVVCMENAPEDFLNLIRTSGVSVEITDTASSEQAAEPLEDAILNGSLDLLVRFPADFSSQVSDYKAGDEIPEIKTYYNPSEDYSSAARELFVGTFFPAYETQLLTERFGDAGSLTPFVIDRDPSSSVIMNEEKASGQMLAMMFPYLIVMLLFTGPMSLGVDAIAGEKERGTMASMLITPARRQDIVLGKLFSLGILSILSAVVYAVSMIFAVPMLYGSSTGDAVTAAAHFSLPQIIQLLIVMISLVFFYVAVVALLSVSARSVKEASSYVSPVYIVVIVAGIMTMFSGNTEPALPLYGIPVYGSALCIQKILTNELAIPAFLLSVAGTLLVGAVLTALITKAFNSEKIMFNA